MEYNIPFSMRDVIPSLYGHWIAKDLMAYLELGHGSRARSDFFRIMNRPNRYFSRDAFETPLVSLDQVRDFYRDRDWMQERVMDPVSYTHLVLPVRKAADHITASNNDDGVAMVVEQFMLA